MRTAANYCKLAMTVLVVHKKKSPYRAESTDSEESRADNWDDPVDRSITPRPAKEEETDRQAEATDESGLEPNLRFDVAFVVEPRLHESVVVVEVRRNGE